MSKHVDLDIATDPYPVVAIAAMDYVLRYGLDGFKVVNYYGPAGGNPIVRFYGDKQSLSRLHTASEQMVNGTWDEKAWPLPYPIVLDI